MTEPRFPPEIIETILDEVAFEKDSSETLRTCCTVSQLFLDICRKHLYSVVIINSPRQCKRILQLALGKLSIVPYIQMLEIMDHRLERWSLPNPHLPHLINIVGANGRMFALSFTIRPTELIPEPSYKPSRNSILDLCEPTSGRTLAATFRAALIRLHPRRRDLAIPPQDKVCTLHTLEIGGSDVKRVMNFLKGPYCALDLTQLRLIVHCGDDSETMAAVGDMETIVGPTLRVMQRPVRLVVGQIIQDTPEGTSITLYFSTSAWP